MSDFGAIGMGSSVLLRFEELKSVSTLEGIANCVWGSGSDLRRAGKRGIVPGLERAGLWINCYDDGDFAMDEG